MPEATEPAALTVEDFIDRWSESGGAERSNYQIFLYELCDLLGVQRPQPAQPDNALNTYVFERSVTFQRPDGGGSTGFIDLYKRGCFVLEAKQSRKRTEAKADALPLPAKQQGSKKLKSGHGARGGKTWDGVMLSARGQAESYAKALPAEEGWPPFLIVVDVGHVIELWADFSRTGKTYTQFPDASSFRIRLPDLARDDVRGRLRAVWEDPLSLDPARKSARVTRDIADRLAKLAKSLEGAGHDAQTAAGFLMRCLFTMFAEDVGLLPADTFTGLLRKLADDPAHFRHHAEDLWKAMDKGGYSVALSADILRFNGGLFADSRALDLTAPQLALLIEAAEADWKDVEPAIFGTLLERALDPRERHKLGAHYTPRAYVERLVMPTVIEPLREDWDNVRVAAVDLARQGKEDKAREQVKTFHRALCATRVLDPACGSGNFLYVTMEHMKRLEGEVMDLLADLGEEQLALEMDRHVVDPHQFLGIEKNPRAAAIAELVLWIGHLQWHFKTRGRTMPAQPVLKNFHNIECRDAVLAWESVDIARDENGVPLSRWDGVSVKKHPVTGEDVPDETKRVEIEVYENPRPAGWPEAEFIVGNPPFIGGWRMRQILGYGYLEAVRAAYPQIPQKADYVMFWWDNAASAVRNREARRFGLITTNSLSQVFQRRVIESHVDAKKNPLILVFVYRDHPWRDLETDAAVRVAMTVGARPGNANKVVYGEVIDEQEAPLVVRQSVVDVIGAQLKPGVAVYRAQALKSNDGVASPGVQLFGDGFIISRSRAEGIGLGLVPSLEHHIRAYCNNRDLTGRSRDVLVIDMFGLQEDEVRRRFPAVYQHLVDNVRDTRQAKSDRDKDQEKFAANWWIFGRPRAQMREAIRGLSRFIATGETSKHRVFQFLSATVLPDNMVTAIASEDAFHLAVLSSRAHITWALAAGGRLGVGNDSRYTKTRCFDPFPFPDPSDDLKARIRASGEELDKHRKDRQAEHPDLTMTGMYNVLEKLRAHERGEEAPLTEKEKVIHEKGLVSVLKDIHDRLDAAVFEAYGWPADLSDEEILERLVALNKERAAEEARGFVRWLRPEFQAPDVVPPEARQEAIDLGEVAPAVAAVAPAKKPAWPKDLPAQVQAVRGALAAQPMPVGAEALARTFTRARTARVAEVLQTLAALGQVQGDPTQGYWTKAA